MLGQVELADLGVPLALYAASVISALGVLIVLGLGYYFGSFIIRAGVRWIAVYVIRQKLSKF